MLIVYFREGEERPACRLDIPCIRPCKVRNSFWLIMKVQGWRCGTDLWTGIVGIAFLVPQTWSMSRGNTFIVGTESMLLVVVVCCFSDLPRGQL